MTLTSMLEAVRYAKRPVELNATGGDHVLVVTDFGMSSDVVRALVIGAHSLGHDVSVVSYSTPDRRDAEPPGTVADAMVAADVALLATSRPIAHTAATLRAAAAGTRCVFMDGITLEMLCHGAATADYDQMARLAEALAAEWNGGTSVRVSSRFGTDLVASIHGRRAWQMAGRAFRESWFGLSGCCAFPDGEVGVAPVEGTANGTLVFDASLQTLGALEEPIRLTIVESRIVSIEGGWQADRMRADLEALDDEASYYCPAEIAIGINESAELTGLLREDKKLLGSCHVAYGANDDIGGTVAARTHVDGLMRRPTVEIDGQVVVADGILQVGAVEAQP
jgi:2,5-dihydroxypyridine 5,6-dioxygenase